MPNVSRVPFFLATAVLVTIAILNTAFVMRLFQVKYQKSCISASVSDLTSATFPSERSNIAALAGDGPQIFGYHTGTRTPPLVVHPARIRRVLILRGR